ncbi:MAG: SAVED domain-containing protein [Acidimicrobiia bacterium]|nr:SAVED domain-containing protein [Acidimicrobiia bacterium]
MAGRRGKVPENERLRVWVRSGGRCAFCNAYLLESDLTLRPVLLGEVAHNVAASAAGPRGDHQIPGDQRNAADNLLLLCGLHHPDADKRAQLDLLTVEQISTLKEEHERRVFEATETVGRRRTVLLRMQGHVRGATVDLGVEAATEAVLRSSNRFPELALSFDRRGVEIDLRQISGELTAADSYYKAAASRIDEVIAQRLRPAVEKGIVPHLSVFAIARFPLLVYLGSRIDDALTVDVFQRHRATENWIWPAAADDDPEFVARREDPSHAPGPRPATDAVLIINASGTIHPAELPAETAGLPTYFVELDGTPHTDSVCSRRVRDSFERAVRKMLGQLEQSDKTVRRIHVFPAAPVSVGVTLGRSVGWGIHPRLVVYDRRDDGSYHPALEVSAQ